MKSKLAVWSFAFSILTFILLFMFLAYLGLDAQINIVFLLIGVVVMGSIPVITGIISLIKISHNPELNGKWMAIIAIVIGSVEVLLVILPLLGLSVLRFI